MRHFKSHRVAFRQVAQVTLPLALVASFVVYMQAVAHLDLPSIRRSDGDSGPAADDSVPERAAAVVGAMRHAWGGYVEHAWGADELQPVNKTGTKTYGGLAATIIDSMSTLHLMGLHDEFARARDWVVEHARFDAATHVSFFETVIRLLGGLLSAHQLSGDPALLERARDLGDHLLPVFRVSSTGIPDNSVHLPAANTGMPQGLTCLAELGSDTLEFGTLSELTGDPKYALEAERGIRALHANYPDRGLLSCDVERSTAKEIGSSFGIGPRADSYYEYLLKWYLLGGKQDRHWLERWELAVEDIMRELLVHAGTGNTSLAFVGEKHGGGATQFVLPHLTCYFGGNLALGVMSGVLSNDTQRAAYAALAANMTQACYAMYRASPLGLAPDIVAVDPATAAMTVHHTNQAARYLQRPEVAESLFYMYRLTGDGAYREQAWDMFQAIEKHTRMEAGYSGLHNAMEAKPRPDDLQESWFLAETLKYLWLIFAPASALPLDEWVLNTEAHPLRVAATPARAAAAQVVRAA